MSKSDVQREREPARRLEHPHVSRQYVIRSTEARDDEYGYPLFWSNDDGWVDRPSATVFSEEETKDPHIPLSGEWVLGHCPENHAFHQVYVRPSPVREHDKSIDIYCDVCGAFGTTPLPYSGIKWE